MKQEWNRTRPHRKRGKNEEDNKGERVEKDEIGKQSEQTKGQTTRKTSP